MQKITTDGLSARTRNVLDRMGITYLEQLSGVSPHEILQQRNAGRKTLNEIRYLLKDRHFTLKSDYTNETPLMRARRTIRAEVKNRETRIKLILLYRYSDKLTLTEIGDIFGISIERTRQILKHEELKFERHKRNMEKPKQ